MKASRRITHFKRLKDAGEQADYVFKSAAALGLRLGTILFQLPPNLKQDTELLRAFLENVPRRIRCAFEFRHDSWFVDETYEALKNKNCALVLADTDDATTPLVATADWGYLRLRKSNYRKPALEKWMGTVNDLGFKDAFVFFKHEDAGAGPKFAKKFMDLV